MKKVLFSSLLLIFVSKGFSQEMSLSDAFVTLERYADKQFSDIKGAKFDSSLIYRYISPIKIYSTLSNEFMENFVTDDLWFQSKILTGVNESDAKNRLDAYIADFKTKYPTIGFVETIEKYKKTYNFVNYADKGLRYYKARFEISKWGNTYDLDFIFPASIEKSYKSNAEPFFEDYYYHNFAADNSDFGKDLQKVMAYDTTTIKSIRGEKIETDRYWETLYKSKFNVSGWSDCYIRYGILKDDISYHIPCYANFTVEEAKEASTDLFKNICAALGPDYALAQSPDFKYIYFVKKSRPDKIVLTMITSTNDDNSTDISISLPIGKK